MILADNGISLWPAARITKNAKPGRLAAACGGLACLLLLAGPPIAYQASPNTYLMKVQKEDMPQYRFAEIIRNSEDKTLLNYGFLDGGFYYASGALPTEKFFCTLNIDLPEMEQSLQNSVRQGKTAFVITRSKELKNSERYHLVDEADLVFEGRNWHYYLYQQKD